MTPDSSRRANLFVGAATAALCAWLLVRTRGLYPAVFADELIYSVFARLTPAAEVTIPSYLYFWIYGQTSHAGTHFLDWVRVLNCVFFAGAMPFYYATARRYCSPLLSAVTAVLAGFAPVSLYTSFFMPETPYFFGFAVLSWFVLTRTTLRWYWHALGAGAILGAMMLVKVHALFLLPALVLYMLVARAQDGLVAAVGSAVLAVAGFFAVRLGLGYIFAGPAGLGLVGSFYGNGAKGATSSIDALLKLLPAAFINVRGHLEGMVLLAGVPMAAMAAAVLGARRTWRVERESFQLRLFALLMLGCALTLAVMYTASIAYLGAHEGLRLHGRYYDFVYPLLFIVGAAEMSAARGTGLPEGRSVLRWVAALAMMVLVGLALWRLPTYVLSIIDGPEFKAVDLRDAGGRTIAGLAVVTLAVWAVSRRQGAALYLLVLLPAFLYGGQEEITKTYAMLSQPNAFDTAGFLAREHIPAAERKDAVVIGSNQGELQHTKFFIDDRDTDIMTLPDGLPLEQSQTPFHRKWLVVIGNHPIPADFNVVAEKPGIKLVKLAGDYRRIAIDKLSAQLPGQVLESVEGFAPAEPWGRWSTQKTLTLHFRQPLPKDMRLVLTVHGYGPNVGEKFILRAGSEERTFRAGDSPHEVFVGAPTDGTLRSVTIEVPHPTIPAGADPSGDSRALGLGLSAVELGTGK